MPKTHPKVRDVLPIGEAHRYGVSLTNPTLPPWAHRHEDYWKGRGGDGAGIPREWAGYGVLYPPYVEKTARGGR